MTDKSVVLLFVKAPVRGQVKSRLAAAVGEEAAVALYENFIFDTLEQMERTGYPIRIFVYPADAIEVVSSWLGKEHVCLPQTGNDLGERMEQALEHAFSEGWGRAVLIGSDLPDLPAEIINGAFTALETSDAVIGPAADGGYYLIGFNREGLPRHVFHNIEWSTETVFRETTDLLRAARLRVHVLPQWHDVDTIDDLKALRERLRTAENAGSRTCSYLETHGDILL